MADSLTFTIQPGASGMVSLRLFLRTVERVRRFVEEVDYAVTGDLNNSWLVAGLHSSTPTVTITPPPGHDPETSLDALAAGLLVITKSQATEPPPHFTADVLDDLREMRPLFRGPRRQMRGREYLRQVDFALNGSGVATVDGDIENSVDQVLRGSYVALGSIEGRLQRINTRGRPSFTIWDRVADSPIRCFFPSDRKWTAQVAGLIDRRVLAVGTIHYFRNGQPRYVDAQEVQDRTPDPELAEAYFGCIPDLTGGLETEDYLERLREGQLGKE